MMNPKGLYLDVAAAEEPCAMQDAQVFDLKIDAIEKVPIGSTTPLVR